MARMVFDLRGINPIDVNSARVASVEKTLYIRKKD